jgi:Asp/Glu/hydantoin racemase
MAERILVINPNSTQSITDQMSDAVAGMRLPGGPQILCETLREGPPGVETQAQVDNATAQLLAWLAQRPEQAASDAIVIGCFSDPGLHALREVFRKPVLGIGESGFNTASAIAERFASIAIVSGSLARHRRKIRALGFEHRYVGGLAVNMGVSELADRERTWAKLEAVGRNLRDELGAQAVVLGCAGFSPYRAPLEQSLGLPVIDPTQAAVALALGQVLAARGVRSERQLAAAGAAA